jgi:hypothetical protein
MSLMINATMTSKGNNQVNTGKGIRNHLSAFNPMNTDKPTETSSPMPKPA